MVVVLTKVTRDNFQQYPAGVTLPAIYLCSHYTLLSLLWNTSMAAFSHFCTIYFPFHMPTTTSSSFAITLKVSLAQLEAELYPAEQPSR